MRGRSGRRDRPADDLLQRDDDLAPACAAGAHALNESLERQVEERTIALKEAQAQLIQSEKMSNYVMALCNNLEDPTEISLWNYVKSNGLDPDDFCKNMKENIRKTKGLILVLALLGLCAAAPLTIPADQPICNLYGIIKVIGTIVAVLAASLVLLDPKQAIRSLIAALLISGSLLLLFYFFNRIHQFSN
jgi:hypothetical protein